MVSIITNKKAYRLRYEGSIHPPLGLRFEIFTHLGGDYLGR